MMLLGYETDDLIEILTVMNDNGIKTAEELEDALSDSEYTQTKADLISVKAKLSKIEKIVNG